MDYKLNNIGSNRYELEIVLETQDYMPEVEKELKKKKKEANFKGFRKGMVPDNFIKKSYGNNVLSEVVNKSMDNFLNEIMKENNMELMLSPILSENQEPLNIDIYSPQNYKVVFDIHKKPAVELKGISTEDSYNFYNIDIDEEIINNEIKNLKTRFGKFVPYNGEINDETIISFFAKELDNNEIKQNGYETEFSVKVIEFEEGFKKNLISAKIGDEMDFDIYNILKDADKEKVHDYLLNIDKKDFKEGEDLGIGNFFRGEIKRIEVYEFAELNEEVIRTLSIHGVNNEDELRNYLREDIKKHYDSESEKLMHLEIADKLKEINEFEISEDYVNAWIKQHYAEKTEDEVKEIVEKSMKDLQWQNIVDILIKKYEVSVSKEELDQKLRMSAASMAGYNQEYIDRIMEYIMQDEKYVNEVYNEMFIEKIFGEISKNITRVEQNISFEEFKTLSAKYKRQDEIHDHEHEHDHDELH